MTQTHKHTQTCSEHSAAVLHTHWHILAVTRTHVTPLTRALTHTVPKVPNTHMHTAHTLASDIPRAQSHWQRLPGRRRNAHCGSHTASHSDVHTVSHTGCVTGTHTQTGTHTVTHADTPVAGSPALTYFTLKQTQLTHTGHTRSHALAHIQLLNYLQSR